MLIPSGKSFSSRVGNYCYIGDNSNFLTWFSTPIGVPGSIYIGNHCIIEPGCSFGSCIIDENVFIGARSIISPGVKIERGAVIAPNSYIPPGRLITSNSLWAGNPVKLVRELQEEEVHSTFIKSYDYWLQTAEKIKQSELDSSSDLQIRDEVNDYVTQNYFNWRAKYYH